MFDKFPREIATPKRRIVTSWKDMKAQIDKYNGKVSLYTTVYAFEKILTKEKYGRVFHVGDPLTAIIDKLFFDLDSKDCYDKILKFHKYLQKLDIMHCIMFSGKGFHLYIFTTEATIQLKYKKDAYFNIQKFFADHIGLTIGESEKADLDTAVLGDLARITRIPNTFNMKRSRYCIPLNEDDLLSGYDTIKEKAKQQHYAHNRIFGRKKVNLKFFDYPKLGGEYFDETPNVNIPPIKVDEDYGKEHFYPCVKQMIVNRSGFKSWFYGALWLREKGYTKQEADTIFKKYLSKFKRTDGWHTDYEHAINSDKSIETVYDDRESKYLFPRCELLWTEGLCPGKCKHYNDMYFSRNKKENVSRN